MKIARYFVICLLLNSFQLIEFKSHAQESDSITEQVLSMSLDELLSLKVITAGKKVQEVKEIPASAVIITRKDIELLGFTSYTEILEHVVDDYYWWQYEFWRSRVNGILNYREIFQFVP